MFYNNFRSTRSALKEEQRRNIRNNIINPKERLMNLQKRKKLKDLLIHKFMDKYSIKYNDQMLENEISNFIQKEKINDVDLQRLDNKIKRMLRNNSAKNILKSELTANLQHQKVEEEVIDQKKEENQIQNDNENNNLNLNNTLNQQHEILLPQVNNLNQEPNNKSLVHSQSSHNINPLNPNYTFSKFPRRTFYNKQVYKKPEEELAELEEELKREESEKRPQTKCIRLDFTKEGDEWNVINKYNKKLYDEQLIEERMKNIQMKRKTKQDLDNQIKEKIKKEYEDELKEKEYDKIVTEHLKKMDEIERKKAEDIKKQIMREKINRDVLLKEEYIRKRIENLKEKKFERELVKNIKENIEKDKKALKEKKIKENEALNKAIKENELKKERLKQQLKKQKEDDILSLEELIKTEEKQDAERKYYFDRIKNYGNKYSCKKAEEILEQMKEAKKKEDEKMQYYYEEKRKEADERERNAIIRRKLERKELKKYLDMQIEEKKKEEDFLKALDYEQARIWNVDVKKYSEDEKIIDNKIREMNKKNLDCLIKQMNENSNKKNTKNKNNMTDAEFYMNRDLLEKAKESLSN